MRVIRVAWKVARLTTVGLMIGTGFFIALYFFIGLFVHMLFAIAQGDSYDGTLANLVVFGIILPGFEAVAIWLIFQGNWKECPEKS